MISAASTHTCWDDDIERVICSSLDMNYSILARRPQNWTEPDRTIGDMVLTAVETAITDSLSRTAFGISFPQFRALRHLTNGWQFPCPNA